MTLPTPSTGLHVRYEKAGLILDALPIPWNADAVIVEANVRLGAKASHAKQDFTLCLAAGESAITAELVATAQKSGPLRVFFRFPAPAQSCQAEVRWREHSLGRVELPMISQAEFEAGITLDLPTLQVALGARLAACRSFVSGQAKSIFASAVLRSLTPLAPALHQDLRVVVRHGDDDLVGAVPVPLLGEQLRVRQALVTAPLPKLRRLGAYRVSWFYGPRCLHSQPLKVIARKAFTRGLRISATRFILERDNGTMQTVRSLPTRADQLLLDGIRAVVPCFYVSCGEAGMAGLAPFALRALIDDTITTLGIENGVLVTDSPTPIVLGAAPAADLARIKHFTLTVGDRTLGNLPLLPAPQADINAEGGFAPLDDFLWSPAAEEQLNERLGKLLGDG
jgi:hypothetical protein